MSDGVRDGVSTAADGGTTAVPVPVAVAAPPPDKRNSISGSNLVSQVSQTLETAKRGCCRKGKPNVFREKPDNEIFFLTYTNVDRIFVVNRNISQAILDRIAGWTYLELALLIAIVVYDILFAVTILGFDVPDHYPGGVALTVFMIVPVLVFALTMIWFVEFEYLKLLLMSFEWLFILVSMLIFVFSGPVLHQFGDQNLAVQTVAVFVVSLVVILKDALPRVPNRVWTALLISLISYSIYQFAFSGGFAFSNPDRNPYKVCLLYCTDLRRMRMSFNLNLFFFYIRFLYMNLTKPGQLWILQFNISIELFEDKDFNQTMNIKRSKPIPADLKKSGLYYELQEKYTTRIKGYKSWYSTPFIRRVVNSKFSGYFSSLCTLLIVFFISTYVVKGAYLLFFTLPVLVYGICVIVRLDRTLLKLLFSKFQFWFLLFHAILRGVVGPLNNNILGGDIANPWRNFCAYMLYVLFNIIALTFDANPIISRRVKSLILFCLLLENIRVYATGAFSESIGAPFCFFYCSDTYKLEMSMIITLTVFYIRLFWRSMNQRRRFLIIKSGIVLSYGKDSKTTKEPSSSLPIVSPRFQQRMSQRDLKLAAPTLAATLEAAALAEASTVPVHASGEAGAGERAAAAVVPSGGPGGAEVTVTVESGEVAKPTE